MATKASGLNTRAYPLPQADMETVIILASFTLLCFTQTANANVQTVLPTVHHRFAHIQLLQVWKSTD